LLVIRDKKGNEVPSGEWYTASGAAGNLGITRSQLTYYLYRLRIDTYKLDNLLLVSKEDLATVKKRLLEQ